MTSPPASPDAPPARPFASQHASLFLLLVVFAALVLLHLPLLRLPYYWDEAGYFVPAARDLLRTGDPVPQSTLSNAHPPLVMAYLALAWRVFGESILVTRLAMTFVAALTLLGVYRLACRVANPTVALATIVCTALYPVFFTQTTLAHLDMTAALFTVWGLLLYLPASARAGGAAGETPDFRATTGEARAPRAREPQVTEGNGSNVPRRLGAVALFALAALAKETAILAPLALFGWEVVCRLLSLRGTRSGGAGRAVCVERGRGFVWSLSLLLAAVPLALWLVYHHARTGYYFGNPEFFRFNVEATVTPARVLFAGAIRLWHVTAYMNLFFLTGAAAGAMLLRPVADAGRERGRIPVPVQLVFAVVTLAYVAALSVVGGAVLARYMLPVLPLVIMVCVSTVWRRARRWPAVVALSCAAFVFALVVNPPYRYPWEENLAYRDFILLHRDAARFLSETYPRARVITAWPASDELKNPHFGYTDRPLAVVTTVERFSAPELAAAVLREPQYDTLLIFSTHYALDLSAAEAARYLGARVVYQQQRRGQWVAVIRKPDERSDE